MCTYRVYLHGHTHTHHGHTLSHFKRQKDASFLLHLFPPQISLIGSPALLPLVSQSNLQGVVSGVYQQGDDILLDTRQLSTSRLAGPLYWRLPPQFEGRQVLLLRTGKVFIPNVELDPILNEGAAV